MSAFLRASLVFLAVTSGAFAAAIPPQTRELHAIGVDKPCFEQTGWQALLPIPPRQADDDRQYCVESGNQVKVVVDRPGKDVLLLLGSGVAVQWNVQTSPNTRILQIFRYGP